MKFIAVGATVATMVMTGALSVPTHADAAKTGAIRTVASAPVVKAAPVATKKKKKWEPPTGAFFNIPRGTDLSKQWTIERQIVGAINHTPKGEYIRISVFSFDRMPVADALIAARKRGVRVQILMNNHQQNAPMYKMYKQIGKSRKKRNFAYRCTFGCRSGFENLHSKFFLFSKTGGAENVVMLGSTNLTANAAINQWNDLYVMKDAAKMHSTFVTLFNQMRKDKKVKKPYYKVDLGKRYQLQVLPFNAFNKRNDPMMKVLNKVKCTGAYGAPGGVKGRTMIRIHMHAWHTKRGEWLAAKTRALYAAGCDIKIIYGMASAPVRKIFATKTSRGALPVHINGYDTDLDGLIDLYGHEKMLTIAGNWDGDTKARYTWTGSSNWANSGMRGDELIFRIKGDGVLRTYHKNFNYIWKYRSHLAKYIEYGRNAPLSNGTNLRMAPQEQETFPKPGGPAWEEG